MTNQSREPNPSHASTFFPVNHCHHPWDRTHRHLGRQSMASTHRGKAVVAKLTAIGHLRPRGQHTTLIVDGAFWCSTALWGSTKSVPVALVVGGVVDVLWCGCRVETRRKEVDSRRGERKGKGKNLRVYRPLKTGQAASSDSPFFFSVLPPTFPNPTMAQIQCPYF